MQVREKVGKSRNTVFFKWFVALEGRKGRLAKAAAAEPSGQMRDEKLHAVVTRSTFGNQNVQNASCSGHFWKLRCRKSERHCGAKHISKSKVPKTEGSGPLLKVQMWFCEGFVAFPKTMAGVGHLQRICTNACRVAGAIQEICSSEMLGGQGADFLTGGAFWSIKPLRDRCSTSYDLASLFRGRRSTLDKWSGTNISKRIGTRPSALHSTFHFWRKAHRIASFLMLSTSKIEEVSQNSFVFEVVKFASWGSLAELLRFWCCQVHKLRKSRGIASFSK